MADNRFAFLADPEFWDYVGQNAKGLGKKLTTLNTPEMSASETAADIGLGFAPGIGTAMSARDFERARRDDDLLGMGLSALGMIPLAGGMVKPIKNAVKALSGADDAVEAPKKIAMQYKRFKSGEKKDIYRGSEAFGGVNPGKLGSMRTKYLEKMEEGAPGKYWYDEASDDIMRITGSSPSDFKRADDLANMLAVTSAQTPVGSNLMYSAKGWNQRLAGDPFDTGMYPKAMGKDIEKAITSDAGAASGLKRSPFSAGLAVKWRGEDFASRPVHDIHDVRAWGITDPKTGKPWSKGVGEAGHRFLDEQGAWVTGKANEKKLGGKDDWTQYRAQAAAWIAQKAKKEGIPIEQAAKHYGDFINDSSALVTRSWIPSNTTNHLKGLMEMPLEEQRRFSDAIEKSVTGPRGVDRLALALGALTDGTLPNAGIYEGVVEPGFASRVLAGKAAGAQNVDASSRKILDAVAATHGLTGVQKQSAWNFMGGKAPQRDASGALIRTGSPMNEAQLRKLQEGLDAVTGGVVTVDPRGGRALIFKEGATDATTRAAEEAGILGAMGDEAKLVGQSAGRAAEDARKPVVNALRKLAKDAGGELDFRSMDMNLFPAGEDFSAPATWSAKPYVEKIEAAGPGVVENFNRNMPAVAKDILGAVEGEASRLGLQSEPFYKPMMEAIARGGLPELKKLIAAGVVPAALLALLLPAIQGSQETRPDA